MNMEASHTRLQPVQIAPTGFSTVWDPPSAIADIAFIHGLQGHPEKTWTYGSVDDESTEQSRSSFFRMHSRFLSRDPLPAPVFWPQVLLSKNAKFEHTRILTWGYDSNVVNFFKAGNQQNISRHGHDLMIDLQQERKDDPSRPLIFVAHSLGGILTKIALDQSRGSIHQPQFLPIYQATIGIVFLGTPHRGSAAADWGLLASNLAKLALRGRNDTVLKGLQRDSELLENEQDRFLQMLEDGTFDIHSFYENRGMSGLYGLHGLVVPPESAQVGHAKREVFRSIEGNHLEICKFKSEADPGYKAVVGVLEDYITLTAPQHAAAQAYAMHSQEAPSQRPFSSTLSSVERTAPNGTRKENWVPQSIRTKLGRQLHSEIKDGRIERIESLLNQGADVDFEDDVTDPAEPALEGCTPLQAAVIRRQLGIARLLLDHGANVEAKNACLYDLRAINLVAVRNSDPFMRLLIGKHANLNAKTAYGLTPLMEAVLHASFVSFRLLLEAGADVNLRMEQGQRPISSDVITIKGDNFEEGCTTEGSTALLLAAQNGELSMVDDLLARGADIECPTSSGPPGITPLIAAAANGHIRVVWSLLDHGCNIHAKAQGDFTALIYAAHYGHEQVVTTLIDRGADIDGKKDVGMTALHEAAFCGHAVVVGVLLDKGASIEARAGTIFDMSEPAPLHIAARCGHAGVVRVLIRRGADVAARTGDDRTALDLAQTYNMASVVEALLARNT